MKWLLFVCIAGCSTEANLGNSIVAARADWSLAVGGRGYEQGAAVAVDSEGDVIVGGNDQLGTIDFGSGPIGTLGTWAFVAKRSGADGTPLWEVALTGLEPRDGAEITGIAVSKAGDVYVAGGYSGTVDFGGTQLTALYGDMFLAKFTSEGALAWVTGLGPKSSVIPVGIDVDSFGNVFVAANFTNGSFSALGRTYTSDANTIGLVMSLDHSGMPRWIDTLDPSVTSSVGSIVVSPTGDIVFAGQFSSAITLGGQVIQAASASQGFLARYHADGSYLWAHGLDPTIVGLGRLTIDANDQIVIGLVFPGVTIQTSDHPETDMKLAAFGPSGDQLASYQIPMLGSVASRQDGTLAMSLWDSSTTDDHLEVSSIDSNGDSFTTTFGKRLATSSRDTQIYASAFGPNGEIVLVGQLAGEVLLGPTAIATHGTDDTDVLVVKIPAAN